jgi:hypothetical protein
MSSEGSGIVMTVTATKASHLPLVHPQCAVRTSACIHFKPVQRLLCIPDLICPLTSMPSTAVVLLPLFLLRFVCSVRLPRNSIANLRFFIVATSI